MRIIAGRHRGRNLETAPGTALRPTAERARAALFNILAHGHLTPRPAYEDAIVLDAFAGTGALGLEALSRGARFASFLEKDRVARALLTVNLAHLGETPHGNVIAGDALRPPRSSAPANLVFLDPPYAEDAAGPALIALAVAGWLGAGALAVAEISAKRSLTPVPGFEIVDERRYGAAKLIFLRYTV
ncbi:MAG TPA: 16S rRNA (guanine(966)-N(2))-methyltransferase RsmD [Stellaceae bacterium]|jgi:16S rRNA (guanine966-N2)-methyltransferase|nr:16S rRNA (guanine(966)-N(2))-methyltransferase RsmD [Stellaceae bacterium]